MTVRSCQGCKKTEPLFACAGCNIVYYCGRACQKADWRDHKRVCQAAETGLGSLAQSRVQIGGFSDKPTQRVEESLFRPTSELFGFPLGQLMEIVLHKDIEALRKMMDADSTSIDNPKFRMVYGIAHDHAERTGRKEVAALLKSRLPDKQN